MRAALTCASLHTAQADEASAARPLLCTMAWQWALQTESDMPVSCETVGYWGNSAVKQSSLFSDLAKQFWSFKNGYIKTVILVGEKRDSQSQPQLTAHWAS